MKRRLHFIMSLTALLLIALTGCQSSPEPTTSPKAATQKLVISNWDNYMPPDLLKNFTKATGIKVQLALHTTNEDIMGKISAANGGGFDLVFVSGPFAQALHKLGWAAELDHEKIPNLANLYPEASSLGYDPGNRYSVPYAWGTTGLCYRTDLVKGSPDSWNDLLHPDPDLAGKMTMLGTDRWLMLPALKQLGYSLNTTDPAEIDKAKELLIQAKENLLGYDDTTFYSKLVSGEASMVEAWDGWCNYGIAENKDIKFVVPKEGSDVWTDTMVVLQDSQNKDAAFKFIDYVLRPEVGSWIAQNILYKVPNRAAMESLSPAIFKQFPNLRMSPAELVTQEPELDLGQGLTLWNEAISEIKAA